MLLKLTKTIALSLLLLAGLDASAQGWERTFGGSKNDGFGDVVPTPDGGFLAVGHYSHQGSEDVDVFLVKTDADGEEEWSATIGQGNHSEYGKSIEATTDGGYIIGGTANLDGYLFGLLVKTDHLGHVEWMTKSSRDSIEGRRAIELMDGGFALVGNELLAPTASQPDSPDKQAMLMKVDSAGAEKWIKNYGGTSFEDGYAVAETPNGFLLAGVTNSMGAGHYDVLIVGADFSGNELWVETWGTVNAEQGFSLAACADGNFVIGGQSKGLTPASEDVLLLKINPQGQPIWSKIYEKPGLESANAVRQTSDGGYVLAGIEKTDPTADRNVLLLKTTADGTEQWAKTFGGSDGDGGNAVRQIGADGYVLAGFTNSFGEGGADGYLLRTDFSGISNSCYIAGNVHSNLNNSCVPDNFGQNVGGYIVEIAGPVTYFGTTDAAGDYSVPVAPGLYNVRLLNPSPYWQLCEDSVDVSLVGNFDTATVNFSMHTTVGCPLLEVDLSTLGLRRCFPGSYSVSYRNFGTVVANPGLVEVTFDEYLEIDSASLPWVTQVGNTYTFDVGNLWPFEGGDFEVFFTVDCDSTVLGQTHCSEARIQPDTFCLVPDPIWDGASIELQATCDGDSVRFFIQNKGDGDMAQPLNFIIIEDHIVQLDGDFQLLSGQDTLVAVVANGATFRMESDQSPGHPGNSQPSVAVEGCGGFGSTGFVVQYPLNDADLAVDTDCRENTGSYDPNDKQGFPLGYGGQHFIEPGTDLEYLVRFQNTGTDTAFTVVIRDTLSTFLDPTSVRPGASSHPYEFELYGSGIVKFTFHDILLPDSNVNEALSHGYVKFRISQRPDLPLGTKITNSAAIYFDFNAPIITNTTFHTLGLNFIEVATVNATVQADGTVPAVLVYPNPFHAKATFELKNIAGEEFHFRLFGPTGQLLRQEVFDQTKFEFNRDGLAPGVYFFQIGDAAAARFSGTVVLH